MGLVGDFFFLRAPFEAHTAPRGARNGNVGCNTEKFVEDTIVVDIIWVWGLDLGPVFCFGAVQQ